MKAILLSVALFLSLSSGALGQEAENSRWADFYTKYFSIIRDTDETPTETPLSDPEATDGEISSEISLWSSVSRAHHSDITLSRRQQRIRELEEKVVQAMRRIPTSNPASRASILSSLGLVYEDFGDTVHAAILHRNALLLSPSSSHYDHLAGRTLARLRLRGQMDLGYELPYQNFFDLAEEPMLNAYSRSPWFGLISRDLIDPNWVYHAAHGWLALTKLDSEASGTWVYSLQFGWVWLYRDTTLWMYLVNMPEGDRFVYVVPGDVPERWFYLSAKDRWVLVPDNVQTPSFE